MLTTVSTRITGEFKKRSLNHVFRKFWYWKNAFRSKTPLYIKCYDPGNTVFLHLISQKTDNKKSSGKKTKNIFWIDLKGSVTSSPRGHIPNSRLREMSLALHLMGMSSGVYNQISTSPQISESLPIKTAIRAAEFGHRSHTRRIACS